MSEEKISEISNITSKIVKQTIPSFVSKLVNTELNHNQYYEIVRSIALQTSRTTQALLSSLKLQETFNKIAEVQQIINNTLAPVIRSYQLNFIPFITRIHKLWDEIPADRKNLNLTELLTNCLHEMYDNKWFPSAVCETSISFLFDYNDIAKRTRIGSKRRKKLLDQLVFTYYDKDFIKNVKREWKDRQLSPLQKRIMNEALRAYERKEYATTVIILSTFWQGLIYEKVGKSNSYRKDSKTNEYFHQLMTQREFSETYSHFFDEYIYYPCSKVEEVKEDVPGRHGIAHSWYTKYPSKKEALNAIFLTDALIDIPNSPQEVQ